VVIVVILKNEAGLTYIPGAHLYIEEMEARVAVIEGLETTVLTPCARPSMGKVLFLHGACTQGTNYVAFWEAMDLPYTIYLPTSNPLSTGWFGNAEMPCWFDIAYAQDVEVREDAIAMAERLRRIVSAEGIDIIGGLS
jgi:predicted esterase